MNINAGCRRQPQFGKQRSIKISDQHGHRQDGESIAAICAAPRHPGMANKGSQSKLLKR